MARRVILADDSVAIHRVVNLTFAGEDIEIISVHNGIDALRSANEQRPDLVIADIFMPGLNGYEVCLRLRQQSATRTVPVILLVGAFESFDETQANEVGATAHIMKPIEPQSLLRMVNGLLSLHKAENGRAIVSDGWYGADSADDRTVEIGDLHIQPIQKRQPLELFDSPVGIAGPTAASIDRMPISLTADVENESDQMERFINSMEAPAPKHQNPARDTIHNREFFIEARDPVRVFNLSEPDPVPFVDQKPAEARLYIPEEDQITHLSLDVSVDEEDSPIEDQPLAYHSKKRMGMKTDELESLVTGLGKLIKANSEGSAKEEIVPIKESSRVHSTNGASEIVRESSATSVSPELVNEITERVVARLRLTLREEVKAAIDDALNEYLKNL